jgi:hypothetical protein
VGLCFLSGCYRHAGDVIRLIGNDELTTEMLIELDRLVQLIESPLLAREFTAKNRKIRNLLSARTQFELHRTLTLLLTKEGGGDFKIKF